MKLTGQKKHQHPALLFLLVVVLIAGAAGLFLLVGLEADKTAKRELERLNPPPSPTSGFLNAKLSFENLAGKTLDPAEIQAYVKGISGVHGLGVFDGSLYVSSWTDKAIYKVDLSNNQRRQLADELNGAHDMVLDDDGKIVTPLYSDDRVVKVDPQTGRVSQFAVGFFGPNGIAKARDGGFYISNAKGGTVVKVSKDGKEIRTIAGGLNNPIAETDSNDFTVSAECQRGHCQRIGAAAQKVGAGLRQLTHPLPRIHVEQVDRSGGQSGQGIHVVRIGRRADAGARGEQLAVRTELDAARRGFVTGLERFERAAGLDVVHGQDACGASGSRVKHLHRQHAAIGAEPQSGRHLHVASQFEGVDVAPRRGVDYSNRLRSESAA